jgi:hypothetical protein
MTEETKDSETPPRRIPTLREYLDALAITEAYEKSHLEEYLR